MRPRVWQLQTAKNRFSELVHKAQTGEPQLVTKNGKAAVYVIDCESFDSKNKQFSTGQETGDPATPP